MVPSQTTSSGQGFTLVTGMGRRTTSRREVEVWHKRTADTADTVDAAETGEPAER